MKVFDFTTVPEDERFKIDVQCSRSSHTLVMCCKAYTHPDDSYLYTVLAQSDDRKDYTVWKYNGSTCSLFWGHYNLPFKKAMAIIADALPEG